MGPWAGAAQRGSELSCGAFSGPASFSIGTTQAHDCQCERGSGSPRRWRSTHWPYWRTSWGWFGQAADTSWRWLEQCGTCESPSRHQTEAFELTAEDLSGLSTHECAGHLLLFISHHRGGATHMLHVLLATLPLTYAVSKACASLKRDRDRCVD